MHLSGVTCLLDAKLGIFFFFYFFFKQACFYGDKYKMMYIDANHLNFSLIHMALIQQWVSDSPWEFQGYAV